MVLRRATAAAQSPRVHKEHKEQLFWFRDLRDLRDLRGRGRRPCIVRVLLQTRGPPPVYTDGVETRHGGGTKSTKFTKNTKNNYFGFVIFVKFVIFGKVVVVGVSSVCC